MQPFERTNLFHLDLDGCVNLRRLPEAIIQLTTIGSLNLAYCSNLTRLPEQLGDMKCLKMLDASYTSIEQLPDSTSQLKKLVKLKLFSCEKLRKLPEQIGNLESLKWFDAGCTSIEQLPDSAAQLNKLVELKLSICKKLRKLPEQIGNMESLESFDASWSAIEHLPDTFACLVNLDRLALYKCAELEQLPEQFGKMQLQKLDLRCCRKVRNITSLAKLHHHQEDMDKINLPDRIKDTKVLKELGLTCDESLCLWLPMILSFSSLEKLSLNFDESQSFSPSEPYSLSTLSNLRDLSLNNRTGSECSLPELPLNLTSLIICKYATLKMRPDLSSLIELKRLYISRAISLQSLPSLSPHLEDLYVDGCTSLQDLPDLSVYKELRSLSVSMCSNLNSRSLKQSFLQVGQHKLHLFEADTADREIGEWFSHKSRGDKICFTIPPNTGGHFFCVGLWVVYKCKYADRLGLYLKVVIINETQDIQQNDCFSLPWETAVGEVQSRIECASLKRMRSGDRINVSFQSFPYNTLYDVPVVHGRGKVKVKMCGAHLIPKTPSPRS